MKKIRKNRDKEFIGIHSPEFMKIYMQKSCQLGLIS